MAAKNRTRKDSARRRREELDRARGAARRGPAVRTDLGDVAPGPRPLPGWYKTVMFGLMILGLLWVCTYYLTQGLFPIVDLAGWNLAIGFGLAFAGFLMMKRWTE